MARMFRSSRPDNWTLPRSQRDPAYRHMSHGPIQPMDKPSFIERLFGMR